MWKKSIIIVFILLYRLGVAQDNPANEITTIAENIEKSLENNYTLYIDKLFDIDLFGKQFMVQNEGADIASFNQSFIEEVKNNFGLGEIIREELGENGTYTFLTVKEKEKDTILVFQVLNYSGLNYHELYLSHISGKYKINDIYNYNRYELLSELMSRVYFQTLYEKFPKRGPTDNIYEQVMLEKYQHKISNLISKKKYLRALKKYYQLPSEIRNKKDILLLAIKAASYTGEKNTNEVLDTYLNIFYSDNRICLLPVDGLYMTGNYDKAIYYIDLLDKEVGGDPFLNYYRGKIENKAGNTQKAVWFYNQLNASMPDEETGYFSLLELYIKNNNYLAAIDVLERIESNFGYYKQDLEPLLQDYSSFRNSDEYSRWKEN
jgi:hypothetical protein